MKKLMFISIAAVGILFVGNAFGQATDWEIKSAVKKPVNVIKKPTAKLKRTSTGDQPELQRKKTQRVGKRKSNFLPGKDDQVLLKRGKKRITERKRN